MFRMRLKIQAMCQQFSLDVYQLCWFQMQDYFAAPSTTEVVPIPGLPVAFVSCVG